MGSNWIKWAINSLADIPIRDTQERKPCDNGGRDYSDVARN
jgi:hypothetical protein